MNKHIIEKSFIVEIINQIRAGRASYLVNRKSVIILLVFLNSLPAYASCYKSGVTITLTGILHFDKTDEFGTNYDFELDKPICVEFSGQSPHNEKALGYYLVGTTGLKNWINKKIKVTGQLPKFNDDNHMKVKSIRPYY